MQCFRLLTWAFGSRAKFDGEFSFLKQTFEVFKKSRLDQASIDTLMPSSGPEFRNRNGLEPIFNTLATQMNTAMYNMIKINFKFKLKKWLNLTEDHGSDCKQRYQSLNSSFRKEYDKYKLELFNIDIATGKQNKIIKSFDKDKTSLTTLLNKLYEIQTSFSEIVRLKVAFYKDNTIASTKSKRVSTMSNKLKRKAYLDRTKIPKQKRINQFTFKDKKPYQIKGIKSFAFSPHKNDWQLSYLPLSRTALIALITNKRFINASYAVGGTGTRRNLIETANVFAYSTNNTNLIDFSKVLFPFSRYRLNEVNRISTNGETVDIYFERNVTIDGVIYEKKQSSRFTSSEKKKAEKKEPLKVIVIDSNIHRESSNKRRKRLKKKKLQVPFKFNKKTKKKSKSSNLVLVGVDPGAKTLATAVSYGHVDSNVKRRNNTSDRDKSVVDRKDPAFKSNSRHFSYSSKQYYHDTKVNERNRVAKMWLVATVKVFKNEAEKKRE